MGKRRGKDTDHKESQDAGHGGVRGMYLYIYIYLDTGATVMVKRTWQDWPLGCLKFMHRMKAQTRQTSTLGDSCYLEPDCESQQENHTMQLVFSEQGGTFLITLCLY